MFTNTVADSPMGGPPGRSYWEETLTLIWQDGEQDAFQWRLAAEGLQPVLRVLPAAGHWGRSEEVSHLQHLWSGKESLKMAVAQERRPMESEKLTCQVDTGWVTWMRVYDA